MFLAPQSRLWQPVKKRGDVLVALALIADAVGSLVLAASRNDQPLVLLLVPGALASILLRRDRPSTALPIAVAVAAVTPGNQQELHDIVAHNVSLMVVKAQAFGATVDDARVSECHGVIGMRQRATLFGGTLSTEAISDGSQVTATLPCGPVAS